MHDRAPDADPATIATLERLARRAVPATVERPWRAWLLRAGPDLPFRRANAAVRLPEGRGDTDPDAFTGALVDFAAAQGIVPRAQLGPLAEAGLDDALAARGWVVEAPVAVMTAPLPLPAPSAVPYGRVAVGSSMPPEWAEAFVAGLDGAAATRTRAFARLVARIEPRVLVARLDDDAGPAAIGIGVVDGTWLGVFGMRTRPGAVRRGAARSVLAALAHDASSLGASRAWLQVEVDATAPGTLYARVGFSAAYRYHYRRAPD